MYIRLKRHPPGDRSRLWSPGAEMFRQSSGVGRRIEKKDVSFVSTSWGQISLPDSESTELEFCDII